MLNLPTGEFDYPRATDSGFSAFLQGAVSGYTGIQDWQQKVAEARQRQQEWLAEQQRLSDENARENNAAGMGYADPQQLHKDVALKLDQSKTGLGMNQPGVASLDNPLAGAPKIPNWNGPPASPTLMPNTIYPTPAALPMDIRDRGNGGALPQPINAPPAQNPALSGGLGTTANYAPYNAPPAAPTTSGTSALTIALRNTIGMPGYQAPAIKPLVPMGPSTREAVAAGHDQTLLQKQALANEGALQRTIIASQARIRAAAAKAGSAANSDPKLKGLIAVATARQRAAQTAAGNLHAALTSLAPDTAVASAQERAMQAAAAADSATSQIEQYIGSKPAPSGAGAATGAATKHVVKSSGGFTRPDGWSDEKWQKYLKQSGQTEVSG